jgi:hypothetical protein
VDKKIIIGLIALIIIIGGTGAYYYDLTATTNVKMNNAEFEVNHKYNIGNLSKRLIENNNSFFGNMDSFGYERNITNNENNLTASELPTTMGLFDVWKLLTQDVDTNSSLEQLPDLKEKIKINAMNKVMVIKNKNSGKINFLIYLGDYIYNFQFISNWNQEDMLKIVNSLKTI